MTTSLPTTRHITIAEGDAGTADTVREMAHLIRSGAMTLPVRRIATAVVADAPDELVQLLMLREWLARSFRFVRDPASGELLHDTDFMLAQLARDGYVQGDCDDAAILAGALACSVGASVALILVAVASPGRPANGDLPYSHVWADATPPVPCLDPDTRKQLWIDYDVTRPDQFDALAHIRRAKAEVVC